MTIDGRGTPDGSAAEGRCGSIDGRGTPDGSAAEGRCGSIDACRALARELGCAPDMLLDTWAERAAIREYDGGQARAEAEREAVEDLRRELAVTSLVSGPRREAVRVAAASSIERRERNR